MTESLQLPPPPEAGWAYFLDFDGTLVEIAPRPDDIVIPDSLRNLILAVYEATGGALAIVSGRPLADLDAHLGLPQLPTAGTHGLEVRGNVPEPEADGDACAIALDRVRTVAHALQMKHPGLRVEDKGGAVAIHFRAVPEMEPFVLRSVSESVGPFRGLLSVLNGKMVVEVKPARASKAGAVERFLEMPPFAGRRPCFIGDDVTDEDGFRACNARHGISIQVGGGKPVTEARYHLDSPGAVHAWLAGLASPQRKLAL